MPSKQNDLVHIFIVTFPAQGHVNPLLRLAKILASKGNLLFTFSTSKSIGKKLKKGGSSFSGDPVPVGKCGGMIRFEFFDDGCSEDNDDERYDFEKYLPRLEVNGKKAVAEMLSNHASGDGWPVSCLINNPYLPWVCDLADDFNIPCAMIWVQSCACFASYYHYQNSVFPFPTKEQPDIDVQLPSMPLLKSDEIPTFLHPHSPYPFLARALLVQFKRISKTFCVLMETFDALEDDLIKYMSEICPIRPVGPLFSNPVLETSSNISGDFIKADECIGWLDSKDPSSVVYISFGSLASLNQEQVTEMAYGILKSGVSFLWVMREEKTFNGVIPGKLPEGFLDAVGEKGTVVKWSPQSQVLTHPSVCCFVTHCGWNSTLEALSSGIPVVTFPMFGDQVTDAKYLVDEWKVGIRMSRGEADNRVIGRIEIEEGLREATSGIKATEMKNHAMKWKKEAEAAVSEGGTTDQNIQKFVDDVRKMSMVKLG